MELRTIERRAAAFASVGILIWAVLASGCAQVLGIEDLPPLELGDAGPSDFAVRGTANGVLGPVAVELRLGSEVELLAVTQDGPFAFETRLKIGASYTVVLVNSELPCTLRNETGVIAGADTAIELACTVPALASVLVSGIAPAITLVPGTTEYMVDLPLSQASVTLTATVATPGDTLAIAGTPLASGSSSEPFTLSLGSNPVDILVENRLGWRRTYRVILRRAAKLAQYAYAKASNPDDRDYFGLSLALSEDTLVVGAPKEDSSSTGINGNQNNDGAGWSGAVYVFRRNGTVWRQEGYLKASNTGSEDHFGSSVALSGDTLAVGAWGEGSAATGVNGSQTDNSAPGSGAVYIFRRSGTMWHQEAYIKASNSGAYDYFGTVALSGDTLAVGALSEDSAATGVNGNQDDNSALNSGAVYIFRRIGTNWQQETYIKASNTHAHDSFIGDSFGQSVTLWGDVLAVGAPEESSAATGINGNQDDNSVPHAGAVYVFRRSGTTWQQEAYIKASDTSAGDEFGYSAALSGDTLVVGAPGEGGAATGINGNQDENDASYFSGAVYVFRRSDSVWQQEAYIKASNTGAGDVFGRSVALLGDVLAVGAPSEKSAGTGIDANQDNDSATQSGAAYLFRRIGSVWQQEAYIKASNTDASDFFGDTVALSEDTFVVGAHGEDSAATGIGGNQADDSTAESGAVYIFH